MEEQKIEVVGQAGQVKEVKTNKAKLIAATAVVVGILLVIGYKVYASPERVWQRFASKATGGYIAKETFSFSYEDLGKLPQDQGYDFFASFSNLKLSLNGSAYTNTKDAQKPEMKAEVAYSFGSGDTTFNSKFEALMLGEQLYLNLGDNPLFAGLFGYLSPNQKVEWIKLDIKAMQELANKESGAANAPEFNYAESTKLYSDIFAKHAQKVLGMGKYLGTEEVRGVKALHYQNSINKEELKLLLGDFMSAIVDQIKSANGLNAEDVSEAKDTATKVINILVNKLEIKNAESWIGQADAKLYKIKLSTNAPSLASLLTLGMEQSMGFEDETTPAESPEEEVLKALEKVSFEGILNYETEIYDYNKAEEVKAPENALDLVKKLEEQEQQMNMYDPSLTIPEQPDSSTGTSGIPEQSN